MLTIPRSGRHIARHTLTSTYHVGAQVHGECDGVTVLRARIVLVRAKRKLQTDETYLLTKPNIQILYVYTIRLELQKSSPPNWLKRVRILSRCISCRNFCITSTVASLIISNLLVLQDGLDHGGLILLSAVNSCLAEDSCYLKNQTD